MCKTTANPVHLVEASSDDVAAISTMIKALHEHESVSMREDARCAAIADLISKPEQGRILLIKNDEGQLTGYVILAFGFSIEFGGRDAYIDELFVIVSCRGRGVGSSALEAVCGWASDYGLCALHLEVERDNETAKALYLRNGFEDRQRYHLMSLQIADVGKKRLT